MLNAGNLHSYIFKRNLHENSCWYQNLMWHKSSFNVWGVTQVIHFQLTSSFKVFVKFKTFRWNNRVNRLMSYYSHCMSLARLDWLTCAGPGQSWWPLGTALERRERTEGSFSPTIIRLLDLHMKWSCVYVSTLFFMINFLCSLCDLILKFFVEYLYWW